MRKFMMMMGAASLLIPATMVIPTAGAEAKRHYSNSHRQRYQCKRSKGTTGLIAGGVAGALLGRTVDTRGDRTVGTVAGAGLGALAGREIDRGSSRRC